MNTKKVIKKVAKTTGKYTLKGFGKGIELASRGTVKTISAISRNRGAQKIATGAGLLAASVAIPTIGSGLIGLLGMKILIDKCLLGNDNKGILEEFNDILNAGTVVTKAVSDKILSPALNGLDKGIKDIGKEYQQEVNTLFR